MKHKHVAIGLIALSIIALAFVSTVAAQGVEYFPTNVNVTVGKYGYVTLFTVDTTSDFLQGPFNGLQVKLSSIIITIYDANGNLAATIHPCQELTILTPNTIYIFVLSSLTTPGYHSAFNVQGTLRNGDTFLATGPGWTFAGHF